jgi:hypothetical protein
MIPVPGHGTYPMGHATQAYVVARLLHWMIAKSHADADTGAVSGTFAALVRQAYQLAFRISMNRIVAGLHFEVDLWAGRRLGLAIADTIAAFAGDAVSGATIDEGLDPNVVQLAPFTPLLGTEQSDSTALSAGNSLFKVAFNASLGEWK